MHLRIPFQDISQVEAYRVLNLPLQQTSFVSVFSTIPRLFNLKFLSLTTLPFASGILILLIETLYEPGELILL